jgi:hypothetical protein
MGRFVDWLVGAKKGPPSAERAAARAMVLSTIVCRGYLEQEHRNGTHENADGRLGLLDWLEEAELMSEVEALELRFLQTPVGQAEDQVYLSALWRTEGLGVLAWVLGQLALPPYDQLIDADAAQQAVGFLEPPLDKDLRKTAALRPASEIKRLASHLTIVSWRLRQFRVDPSRAVPATDYRDEGQRLVPVAGSTALRTHTGPGIGQGMDFADYLRRHARFQEYWLEGLRFEAGDLALGGQSIAAAAPDAVKTCASIAVERQIAAYWLRGDQPLYSKVQASTLLSGC